MIDGRAEPMKADGAWWTLGRDLEAGHDYGFLLDDDPTVLPDPRSMWQPSGVHRPSRTFDVDDFRWSDHRWTGRQLAGGVIYEMHVGTFTGAGTLLAAIDRLDHLVELGVDFVELLPVNSFNGDRNWGYDGVLWYAVDETYGGPSAYRAFVDACHVRGIAVIQDVVYNHLGPSGNYLPRFGPYLHDEATNTWGPAINLAEPEVRRYIVDNALMWLRDFHVDGLRLDAVHAFVDDSEKPIVRELADEVAGLSAFVRRPLTIIAESDLNDPTVITPREAGGWSADAQWSDDFHHALHVALTGETFGYFADFEHLDALAKVYTRGFFHDGTYSSFRSRPHGRPIDVTSTPAWRLVVSNQTHDQVGNRAAGDRLSASVDLGQLSIAAVLTLCGPFTPMLFMGEEWGASNPWQFFSGHPEPELAQATASGRLVEFARMGWDPAVVPDAQDPETFLRSKLDWSEVNEGDHRRLSELYRSLIRLRRRLPELSEPWLSAVHVDLDESQRWFAVRRRCVVIVVNFGGGEVSPPFTGSLLVTTDEEITVTATATRLPPHSAAILRAVPRTH